MASQSSSPRSCLPQTFPTDAIKITKSRPPREKAMKRAFALQSSLIRKLGKPALSDLGIHPVYPFSKLLTWRDSFFMPKQLSHFYWYLASAYTIAVEVQTVALHTSIRTYLDREDLRPAHQVQMDMLQWFRALFWWDNTLEVEWRKIKGGRPCDIAGPRSESFANPLRCYTILLLNIKCYHNRGLEPIVSYDSTAQVYRSSEYPMITIENPEYKELQKILFLKNKIIPEEVWPKPEDDAPWEQYPPSYVKKLKEDCSCYMISTDYGIESPPSSSTSQNPQTSSLFQDSQDPYDYL